MGDVANLNGRIGFRGYTRKDIVNKDKGILAFSPTNIVSNKLIKTSKDTYITVKKYDESPEIKLKNGYVLFVKTGSTLGKSALIKELSQPATVNPQIVVIKPERINASFMSIILLNDKVQRQVFSRKIGGAVPTLTENEINNFNFNIPKTAEQQSISEIIECLNNFLSLQQRKLNQLKRLKRAMLQQLFADKNSKQPNLRFKNFKGDWEQHKLKSVVSVNSGKDYKSLEKGNIPVYGTGGYITSVSKSLSNQDAIGLGRKGTINKPYILKAPFWTVDTLFYLTLKPENILTFIYSLIQKINWLKYDESTGLPSLSKKNIENVLVSLTKLDEQQKIGKVIVKLDKFITLHQSKIDQLTILKKYLLQKLFI